ncbi:MAG: hypothetical protein HY331_16215 [Chloroflexi bacterium]|nr:hypothetical protein [Chloroflexota bacterium]
MDGYGSSGSNVYIQRLYTLDTGVTGTGYIFRGLQVDADFSGPGNPTLIGLDVDVSGANPATRYAAVFQGGSVGIGISTPGERLHLTGGNAKIEGNLTVTGTLDATAKQSYYAP